ncbi:NAD-dependent epimerase/dehydratase family protein [Oceanobacillus sp. CF4.6]|uniref:NAD-dependent epimerase/dehydratase family protein n=1 Tax=Oceanobacillus sp. CF4.6 TaxID=3373080 RepID=UPI003EE63F5E
MKKILITGKNSYVGNSFETWLENYPGEFEVNKISVRDDSWKEYDFAKYDVVLHVAGIAHLKETKENKEQYYKVNRDLAYEIATKAKNENVNHFVFLSSMSVYGLETGVIKKETQPEPRSNYGKSKLQAEQLIKSLKHDNFKVAVLRPPMIYGENCKGNYPKLVKVAKITPIFPDFGNKRSMIYIDNLSAFIKIIIDKNQEGTYFPQNKDYVNITELVSHISQAHNRKIIATNYLNWLVRIGLYLSGNIRKVFGTLIYDEKISIDELKSLNEKDFNYETISFQESILKTEKEYR